MSRKRKTYFSLSFILSVILHVGLIGALIYSALADNRTTLNAGEMGQSIDAIIVDGSVLEQQKNRLAEQQKDNERIKSEQEKRLKEENERLEKQKQAELEKVKQAEKERLLAERQAADDLKKLEQEKQKALEEAQKAKEAAEEAKAEAKKVQEALAAQQKAESEAKLQAQKAKEEAEKVKQKAEQEKKAAEKAAQEAKIAKQKAEKEKAEAKRKAEEAKKATNSVLDDMLSSPNKSANTGAGKAAQQRGNVNANKYIGMATAALQRNFRNPGNLYTGKECQLKIRIDTEGNPIEVKSLSGDGNLCAAAVSAATVTKFPKPTATEYRTVKEMFITFQPK